VFTIAHLPHRTPLRGTGDPHTDGMAFRAPDLAVDGMVYAGLTLGTIQVEPPINGKPAARRGRKAYRTPRGRLGCRRGFRARPRGPFLMRRASTDARLSQGSRPLFLSGQPGAARGEPMRASGDFAPDDDAAFDPNLQTFLGNKDSFAWLASEEGRCCLSEQGFRLALCRAQQVARHRERRSSPRRCECPA
jgi:hypothetical protein